MAFTGDLGRVQGAGWFHTSATSSTSINVSSLQPQLTPFVGDAVAFPNGDIRQITGVSSSAITLGDVLFSFKGDPGIGNATLSNTDGDSREDGFTQAAVKGVAQAKNYYNEGVYESSVSTSNDTVTVTRKTGYVDLGTLSWEKYPDSNFPHLFDTYISDLPIELPESGNVIANVKCAGFSIVPWSGTGYGSYEIGLNSSGRLSVQFDSATTVEEFLRGISGRILQYELATEYQYTEKVIENQPIHIANQEECLYWHEEWRKGLNLYKGQQSFKEGFNNLSAEGKLPVGTYTIIIRTTSTQGNQLIGGGITQNDNVFVEANIPTIFTTTTTEPLNIYINDASRVTSLMLVRGTVPYPYEPYYGELVREKDLSGIQLFSEDVNPAQTIGGDWEDLGTVTLGSTTLHAYQKVSGGN